MDNEFVRPRNPIRGNQINVVNLSKKAKKKKKKLSQQQKDNAKGKRQRKKALSLSKMGEVPQIKEYDYSNDIVVDFRSQQGESFIMYS